MAVGLVWVRRINLMVFSAGQEDGGFDDRCFQVSVGQEVG